MRSHTFDEFLARKPAAGVFLDFDGTLSEIVPVAEDARPLPGARRALERLASEIAVVAVVSGRSAHQLLDWLGSDIEIWGVHGAQRTREGRVVLADGARPYEQLMRRALAEVRREIAAAGIPGVDVEDKGVVVALHYRRAGDVPDAQRRVEGIAHTIAERHDLAVGSGRAVFELKPVAGFSKASVVRERARAAGLKAAAFIGDDVVDLPAFDALDELSDAGLATVRVAVGSDEAPPEVLRRADVVVDGPNGVVELLDELGRA